MLSQIVRRLRPIAYQVHDVFAAPESKQAQRRRLANRYLRGAGIEIGALHRPLTVPARAVVRYVDRLPLSELRAHYPELSKERLTEPDVLDDGEHLRSFADASQDFVIANHFLEHCQDPVGTLQSMLRVLRPSGVLYLAVPDKRYTFDRDRPVTDVEHVFADFAEGPERSRRQHFEEWVRLVDTRQQVDDMAPDSDIHYHVWTQKELLELLVAVRVRLDLRFDVALFARNSNENIAILEKLA